MTKEQSLFTAEDFEKLDTLFNSASDNFVELMAIVGIDPRNDLRHADLVGCDFSNCDLRGYDFTGADLSGTTGTNVVWDETTILIGATVSRSIFEEQR